MTENTTASGAANTISGSSEAILEQLEDALVEWSGYVTADDAPRTLREHASPHIKMLRAELGRLHALAASAPVAPTRIDADRLTDRLMSSDPEFDDCADAASLIQKQAASIELLHVAICQAVTLLNAAVNPFRVVEANDILRHALVAYADSELANPKAAPVAPAPQPAPVKIVRDFRWDSDWQHHVPTLLLEFEPVPANSPIDAKGWNDRDDVAIMLAASFRCAP